MTYTSSITLRSALFIFACLFHTAAFSAEAKVGDKFGDWVFECRAVTAGKSLCFLTQTVLAQKGNRRLLKLSLGHNVEKKENELAALVPLGIHIPSGVSGTIGQDKPFALVVQTCNRQGCVATAKVDAALLKSIQAGEKLAINFSTRKEGKPIVVEATLKGLADGVKAINLK